MGIGSSGKAKNGYAAVKMPTLTGTEKQVQWANDIREKAVSAVKEWVQYREKMADQWPAQLKGNVRDALFYSEASLQSTKEAAKEFFDALARQTTASALINARNRLSQTAATSAIKRRAFDIDKQKKRGRFQ